MLSFEQWALLSKSFNMAATTDNHLRLYSAAQLEDEQYEQNWFVKHKMILQQYSDELGITVSDLQRGCTFFI